MADVPPVVAAPVTPPAAVPAAVAPVTPPPAEGLLTGIVPSAVPPVVAPVADPVKAAADAKTAADKVAADAAAAVVPADGKYAFAKPAADALHADDEADVAAEAKALGMTVAQAQKLYDHRAVQVKSAIQAMKDQDARTQKEYRDQLMADAEFGGTKFEGNVLAANKVLARFDIDKSLTKMLGVEGMGNNPTVAKFLARVGQAMAEGKWHDGTITAPATTGERTFDQIAEGLFPTLAKKP